MKKGTQYTGSVSEVRFPNKGVVEVASEDGTVENCIVKNTLPGQKVKFRVNKKKNGSCEGLLMEVAQRSPLEIEPVCPHFGLCGGCTYLSLPYPEQLKLKEEQVKRLMHSVRMPSSAPFRAAGALEKKEKNDPEDGQPEGSSWFEEIWEGIEPSPLPLEYRNKMEFSFGDLSKGGELELGLHKMGSFYDVLSVPHCRIVDGDYRSILKETLSFFRGKETPYYHKQTHKGYLRHLLVRKGYKTGEILVDIITSSQTPPPTICTEYGLLEDWRDALLSLKLEGKITGILHTVNDSASDAVKNEGTELLYGREYFFEELLGLRFRISPFSFFQTNSLAAEILYKKAGEYIMSTGMDKKAPVIFDLYSGTGTIAQMMASAAEKVIGVEIVEEAVLAARENAQANGLDNCSFIAGDVLKVLDEIDDRPDMIILDPPRDGIHPKAITKILNYGVSHILYISCKPTSLARDLEIFAAHGYFPERMCSVDNFPASANIETICLLTSKD